MAQVGEVKTYKGMSYQFLGGNDKEQSNWKPIPGFERLPTGEALPEVKPFIGPGAKGEIKQGSAFQRNVSPILSQLEAFVRPAAETATLGVTSKLIPAIESIGPTTYPEEKQKYKERSEQLKAAFPKTYGAGDIAGYMGGGPKTVFKAAERGVAKAGVGPIAKWLRGIVGTGLGIGATEGIKEGVKEGPGAGLTAALESTGPGAVGAAALSPIGIGLEKFGKWGGKRVMESALKPPKGIQKEIINAEKLAKKGMGEPHMAFKKIMETPGLGIRKISDNVDKRMSSINEQVNNLVSKSENKVNASNIIDRLRTLIEQSKTSAKGTAFSGVEDKAGKLLNGLEKEIVSKTKNNPTNVSMTDALDLKRQFYKRSKKSLEKRARGEMIPPGQLVKEELEKSIALGINDAMTTPKPDFKMAIQPKGIPGGTDVLKVAGTSAREAARMAKIKELNKEWGDLIQADGILMDALTRTTKNQPIGPWESIMAGIGGGFGATRFGLKGLAAAAPLYAFTRSIKTPWGAKMYQSAGKVAGEVSASPVAKASVGQATGETLEKLKQLFGSKEKE